MSDNFEEIAIFKDMSEPGQVLGTTELAKTVLCVGFSPGTPFPLSDLPNEQNCFDNSVVSKAFPGSDVSLKMAISS